MAPAFTSFFDRDDAAPLDTKPDWRTWFYLVAQLVGGAGLTLLLATMLWPTSKRKPRNPLLISLCLSWWITSFPSVLLLYYAGQVTGPPPAHNLCLASAVLTMSQAVLAALTALSLIFHIWLVIQTAIGAKFTDDRLIPFSTMVCLAVPWTSYTAVAFAVLGLGLHEPQSVQREGFYCVVNDKHLTQVLGVVGSVAMLGAIIFEVWTVVLLCKNRSCLKQLSRDGRRLDFSLVSRVCVFGAYILLGLVLSVGSVMDWSRRTIDMLYCTFPIAVFIVFGTQPDIWRIWCDASRQITSRRSSAGIMSQQSRSIGASPATRFSFPFFGILSRHPRRASAAHASYHWSPTSTHASPLPPPARSLPPTLPLPAALRPSLRHNRPSFFQLQPTPDLLPSARSSPTSLASPLSDTKTPDAAQWHALDALRPARTCSLSPTSECAGADVDGGLRLCGAHADRAPAWSYPPSVIDLRASSTYEGDGAGPGFGGSSEFLHVPAAALRGDSPVWDAARAGTLHPGGGPNESAEWDEDGVRVWRAL
ncbi:hypothetical protein PsYK624_093020 [Phanerochaete sordida]|uniref:Uncharacterized protein n=1 Tax=Phanerochaete sordida TaxID=48140 RepID=A0A9P3GDZ4_9APHY|nr:hypothetical protein PsYK624_093020 [Phanerochaete sordida]